MIILRHDVGIEWPDQSSETRHIDLIVYGDPDKYTAMTATVGFPTGIAAKMILESKSRSLFLFCRGEAGQLSSAVRLLLLFFIAPCFLPSLLPPLSFLDLSSDNPPILAVAFLVFCNLLLVSVSDLFVR